MTTRPVCTLFSQVSRSLYVTRDLALAAFAAALSVTPSVARADAVTDWYAVVQTVRERVPPASDAAIEQASPLVALAMYDAVVAIEGDHRPFLGPMPAPPGASAEAAAHAAAHRILVATLPDDRAHFDKLYNDAIGAMTANVARSQGIAIGVAAAVRLLKHRAGSLPAMTTSFRPSTDPGVFLPPQLPAREWIAGFRPFVLGELKGYRIANPPTLAGAAYARDYQEVQSVGARGSRTRTDEQTKTAIFWNSTSLGQLLPQFFRRPGRSLSANARLYAIYASAEFDMAIVLVREKYRHNFWRPVTALRNGDVDGNPKTDREELWEPLLTTPAHPDYPCGHCLVGALTATIMTNEIGPEPQGGFTITSGGSAETRRYASFAELDAEISNSRIWGGVHFRSGAIEGAKLGRRIARDVIMSVFSSAGRDARAQENNAPDGVQ